MAYYYKLIDSDETAPSYKGFCHQKFEKSKNSGPKVNFDFSKYVLIELLDDSTPEAELWKELGLSKNKNVVHKRMMIDPHRVKCRRAIIMCVDSNAAKLLAEHLSQSKIMKRCICAVVIEDLMSDLRLFEKQIIQFGDTRPQHQLLYVSDLSRPREPAGLVRFLKETFSSFGTILSVFVCEADNGYAYPEGIIKFAYLSEAFAAELVLDQYVVGMERLSVISHHNILLSQCDLRLRLRSAQFINFSEYDSVAETHLLPYDYELNQLSMHDSDLINSVSNLLIKSGREKSEKEPFVRNQCDSKLHLQQVKCENLSDCFIKHSYCSSNKIFDRKNYIKSVSKNGSSHLKKKKSGINHCALKDASFKNNSDYTIDKRSTYFTEIASPSKKFARSIDVEVPFYSSSQSVLKSKSSPMKKIIDFKENKFIKDDVSNSDPDQFSSVSKNYIKESRQTLKLSTKLTKKSKRFVPSQKLCLKSQRSGLSQSEHGNSKMIKDEFATCSSQLECIVKNEISTTKDLNMSVISAKSLSCLPLDSLGPAKVHTWLSHLPKWNNSEYADTKDTNLDTGKVSQKLNPKSSHYKRRITIHTTPALREPKSNIYSDGTNSCSESNCVEKEDPGDDTIILSDKNMSFLLPKWKNSEYAADTKDTNLDAGKVSQKLNPKSSHYERRITIHTTPALREPKSNIYSDGTNSCSESSCVEKENPGDDTIILSDKNMSFLSKNFKSPLQAWLKQELLSSINNTVGTSDDASKSIIVLATKTKDIVIYVGCSHMTCESCYPNSTNLLLGYG